MTVSSLTWESPYLGKTVFIMTLMSWQVTVVDPQLAEWWLILDINFFKVFNAAVLQSNIEKYG